MKCNPAILTPHGIDLTAPGGLEALFAFRRAQFGNAVMMADGDGGAGSGGSGGSAGGSGDGGAGGAAGAGAGAGGDGGDGGDGDEPLGDAGKRALVAEREASKGLKTENATLKQQLADLQNAGKTAEQKEAERIAELEKSDREKDGTLAQKDRTILQYQVAAAKGLDLEAAERLRGATKEEIEADADAWIKKWGSKGGAQSVPGAGAGDSGNGRVESAPGQARMRSAYEANSK